MKYEVSVAWENSPAEMIELDATSADGGIFDQRRIALSLATVMATRGKSEPQLVGAFIIRENGKLITARRE